VTIEEEIRASHARAQTHLDNARVLEGARRLYALRFYLALGDLEDLVYRSIPTP